MELLKEEHRANEILKLLLQDKRIDSSFNFDQALCLAVEKGNIEIIILLLKDHRVKPTTCQNYPIFRSYELKFKNVTNLLFKDEKVRSSLKKYNKTTYDKILREINVEKLRNF